MHYCRRCGAELPKNAGFCPVCGTSVVIPETKPIETHKPQEAVSKPEVVVPDAATESTLNE